MIYEKSDFSLYSNDSQRVIANLEQGYQAWLEARRELEAMPVSMYWAARGGSEYLYVKETSSDSGVSAGARDAATEERLARFSSEKEALKVRVGTLDVMLGERTGLYRRLRLPSFPDRPAEILRRLDLHELLGGDLMVVGANAFPAYEIACGVRFPAGGEETEDFDLAWCRGSGVALLDAATASPAGSDRAVRPTLLGVLRSIDSTYRINPRKRYQAKNDEGYEVELLAAPSTHPLPKGEGFDPAASLIEQEWLLRGRPLSQVVATPRGRSCPLYVPDPRWMALHKLWLTDKPERREVKRAKDRRQGEVLLDAVRWFLRASHPLDTGFVLDLPDELRPIFDAWAHSRGFIPGADAD